MQRILDEIKATPGVLGASVFNCKDGIIASNLPELFKPDVQLRIGNILHRIFKLNPTVQLDVSLFEIEYDEALLLVKRLCDASSILIICNPDTQVHLVNMTTSLLASDLLEKIDDSKKKDDVPRQPADLESVLKGPLDEKLALMKRALAREIGPIAGKALKKAMGKWLEQGDPSPARLKELANIMELEIDDKAAIATFRNNIYNII